MRNLLWPLACLCALSVAACGTPDDDVPVIVDNNETNNTSSNNTSPNNTSPNNTSSNNTSSNNATPNNVVPNSGTMGCAGCINDLGECVSGVQKIACGAGGNDCVACEGEQVCDWDNGTCVIPPSCDSDNCDGCCTGTGECQSGDTSEYCGIDGLRCYQCAGEESCESGICVAPCGSDNCAGCCAPDGTCVAGEQDDGCGIGGEDCAICDGQTETCDQGECADLSCAQSCAGCCVNGACEPGTADSACGIDGAVCNDCGANRLCTNNVCEVDPQSRWDFVIWSGEVSQEDENFNPWDSFGGLPDVYIEVRVYDDQNLVWYEGRSSTQDNDLTPTWIENIITDIPARALNPVYILVWDDDPISDTLICGMRVDTSSKRARMFDSKVVEAECTGENGVFGRVAVKIVPH